MSAKLLAHGGEDFFSKGVLLTRTEASVERRRENVGGHCFIDRGLNRPAALAGIGHVTLVVLELRILVEGDRRQVQQPGSHHTSPAPHLGDFAKRQTVAMLGGQSLARCVAENVKSLGVGLHQAVLDAVVDHLYKMARPNRTTVQITAIGGRLLCPFWGGGRRAVSRREGRTMWVQPT